MDKQGPDISRLLRQAKGHGGALPEDVLEAVYVQLKHVAATLMSNERREHTLQPTILVHEAWMRLAAQRRAEWDNRAQFFAVAARVMRRMLANHARERAALKRGGGNERLTLDSIVASFEERSMGVTALDERLGRLAEVDPEASEIVEQRFFAGMSILDVARERGVSESTVRRAWIRARTWLQRDMGDEMADD